MYVHPTATPILPIDSCAGAVPLGCAADVTRVLRLPPHAQGAVRPPLAIPPLFFCSIMHTSLPQLFFVTSFIRYADKMQLVQAFATGGYVGPTPTATGGG